MPAPWTSCCRPTRPAARVIMDTAPICTGTPKEQQELQARERKPHLPVHITTTSDFAFVRYIGHPKMQVNAPLLDYWAKQFADWYKQGLTIYAFCHCPYEVHSPQICYQLYQRVRAHISLPPLNWQPEEPESEPEQMRLF